MIKAREEIRGLVPYTLASKERKEPMRLDLNENLMGLSGKIIDAIKSMDLGFLSQYPNYSAINPVIQEKFSVESDQFLLTNGLDNAIKTICQTFIIQEDKILIPTPTFSMYERYGRICGGEVIGISLTEEFDFPYFSMEDQLQLGIKMVFMCSPNNPTGSVIDPPVVLDWLENYPNTLFVMDEAYVEFQGFSMLENIQNYPNLLVLRTMSKAYGLAGLRLGLVFGNSDIINLLKVVIPPFAVNNLVTKILPLVLDDTQTVESYVNTITQNREWLGNELEDRGFSVYNCQANFLLAKLGSINNYVVSRLKEKGVLIRNQDHNPELVGWSRVTIGPHDMLQSFLNILDELLQFPVLLFDLDDVLVNVENSYKEAIKQTVVYFSESSCSEEEIAAIKRIPGFNNDWDVTAELLKQKGKDIPRIDIIDKFQKIYLGNNFDGTILNEKLLVNPVLLERLASKYRLGIVTGRPRSEAEFTLNYLDLSDYFSCLITLDEVSPKHDKPSPRGIELALKTLKGSGGYYFGDTVNDMIAAQQANLIPIGVTQNDAQELRDMGAKDVLASINDLEDVL